MPIVLLNLGQAEAFSWALVFAYISGTCLETLLLILIVIHRGALNRTSLVLAGASLVLLPLTYGGGLVFAAMMVPWMVYQGWAVKATTEPSRRDIHPVALAAATVTVIIIGLYFVGYRAFNNAPFYVEPGLFAYAKTALKYLASGFGRGASLPWKQVPCALLVVILLLPRQESFASLHILTRRASEGSEALPSLARRVSMSFFGARVIATSLCLFKALDMEVVIQASKPVSSNSGPVSIPGKVLALRRRLRMRVGFLEDPPTPRVGAPPRLT